LDYQIGFYVLLGIVLLVVLTRITKQSLSTILTGLVHEIREAAGLKLSPSAINFWLLLIVIVIVGLFFGSDNVRNVITVMAFAKTGVATPKPDVGLFVMCMLSLGMIIVLCVFTVGYLDPKRPR